MYWKYFEHKVVGGEQLAKADPDNCFPEFVPIFVDEYGYLPIECRNCWKPLLFWNYSSELIANFKKMLDTFPASVDGKYDDRGAVFYTDSREKLDRLLSLLNTGIREYGVRGQTQWRVSGRYWQDRYPKFFASTKELVPVTKTRQVTMRQWMEKNGLI